MRLIFKAVTLIALITALSGCIFPPPGGGGGHGGSGGTRGGFMGPR